MTYRVVRHFARVPIVCCAMQPRVLTWRIDMSVNVNVNVRVQRHFRGCPIKATHQKTLASLVQPSSTRATIDIEQSRLWWVAFQIRLELDYRMWFLRSVIFLHRATAKSTFSTRSWFTMVIIACSRVKRPMYGHQPLVYLSSNFTWACPVAISVSCIYTCIRTHVQDAQDVLQNNFFPRNLL